MDLDPSVREAVLAAVPSLRAFAISLCGNVDRADDLVQETLLRALANIDSFQPGTNMSAWLFTILRNLFRSEYRKRRREVEDGDGSYAEGLKSQPEQDGRVEFQEFREALAKLPADQREALILRAMSNLPAVPRFFDFVHKGQSAQLMLEYINGQDMQKILDSNGGKPFEFDKVIEWGKSICDVLGHMHTLTPPLVHRDVKPENIMLLEDGRSIKMIDFGTARDVGRSQKTRLASKTRVYTEGYAPPEQILGKPEVRSDLFALAGTLYHLLTGKAPEGYYTARELETQLAAPNGAIPAEQRWLYELIKINLAEDVNDRYFSCREFKTDLERRRVTREAPCPKCQASNPVRQPYCQKCAEPLTDLMPACGHCGKQNRLGSRCCIQCGNRLR